jgi:hypothetical protein
MLPISLIYLLDMPYWLSEISRLQRPAEIKVHRTERLTAKMWAKLWAKLWVVQHLNGKVTLVS